MKDLIKFKYDGYSMNHNSKIQLIYSKQHRFELMWHYINGKLMHYAMLEGKIKITQSCKLQYNLAKLTHHVM